PNFLGGALLPPILHNFDGLKFADGATSVRPDPALGANAPYVVEGVNGLFKVYTAAGAAFAGPFTFNSLFAGVKHIGATIFEPQITWDAQQQRWLIFATELRSSPSTHGWIDFAISKAQNPNPVSAYWVFQLDMGPTNWCDLPTLGLDYWGIWLTCSLANDTSGLLTGNMTIGFNKAEYY